MKTLNISDQLFDRIKDFVVDPFDDTPEIVLSRIVEIATKAKHKWSPLDTVDKPDATIEMEPEVEENMVVL